ncbi:methyltransferase domain-containing protein [Sulfurovum sp.]|uniref:class I SAM-dependent methyltransferase n=1 Tax=Sulfurovum sp. TaxID=1969726 RepID=UPI0025DF44BE|nr:methyltransferase domain-containing protein [Sulfurovum sp.]
MALEDKLKWNKKYQNNPMSDTPIELITKYAGLATGNKALDIACGMGRHSKYLASLGFEVDALDVSSLAIASLQDIPHIHAKEVDFDAYILPKNHYDLVICTFFLKRELFPQIINALKPGGILIYETFVYHPQNEQVPSKRSYLLEEGELENAFKAHLELIESREYWTETMKGFKMKKASFVGKKS